MRRVSIGAVLLLSLLILSNISLSKGTVTVSEYEGIQSIKVEAVTGNIDIQSGAGDKLTITFRNELKNPSIMKVDIDTVNGELSIKETFSENNPKGETHWILEIPSGLILQSLDCITGSGNIRLHNISIDNVKAHSGGGGLSAVSLISKDVALSTTSEPLTAMDCSISNSAKFVSSDGKVKIKLPALPSERLEAASTGGQVTLQVPSFGDNFNMSIMKNAGKGMIFNPFKCTHAETKRFDKNDAFLTDLCVVKKGDGGPEIKLLTGSGTIKIQPGNRDN